MGTLIQFMGPTSNLSSDVLSPTHHIAVGSSDYNALTALISGAPPSKACFELALLCLPVKLLLAFGLLLANLLAISTCLAALFIEVNEFLRDAVAIIALCAYPELGEATPGPAPTSCPEL
jgi:high-affinity K+ transport system ATPase subunit B